MTLEICVERALREVFTHSAGSLQGGQGGTLVRRTAIADGEDMGNNAEPICLD
jgi:hypothetical protein